MLCGVVNVLYLFGIVHFNCVSGLLFFYSFSLIQKYYIITSIPIYSVFGYSMFIAFVYRNEMKKLKLSVSKGTFGCQKIVLCRFLFGFVSLLDEIVLNGVSECSVFEQALGTAFRCQMKCHNKRMEQKRISKRKQLTKYMFTERTNKLIESRSRRGKKIRERLSS